MTTAQPSSVDSHDALQMLLPWYVNGTLDAVERQRIDAHLPHCEDCRAAIRFEQQLRDTVRAPMPAVSPSELGLARLKRRIAADRAPVPATIPARPAWRQPLLRAALAAGLVAVVLIPMSLRDSGEAANYHTLSSAPASGAIAQANDVRIVFTPAASERDIAEALARHDGLVLDGPNSAGAYTVRLQAVAAGNEALQSAIDALRREPNVQLAESIAPVTTP